MRARWLAAALALAVVGAGCGGASAPESGDAGTTVVQNVRVHTADPGVPTADAFAYGPDGRIIAVGTEDDVRAAAGPDPTIIDGAGGTVLPGFQDAHVHVPEAGLNGGFCPLPPGETLAGYEELLRECSAADPDADWVRAAGASLFDLRDTVESPREVLDRAVPDRPAIVLDDLGHAAWVNSRALAAAGISDQDPDPAGGVLHRRTPGGQLSGLLLENAQHRAREAAAAAPADVDVALRDALAELNRNGITTVSDAGGFWGEEHPAAWKRIEERGELTVRASNTLYVYPDRGRAEQLQELRDRFDDDGALRFDTAKIYVDGILDLGTALLTEPYDRPPDPRVPRGFRYFAPDELDGWTEDLHAAGFRINFHVIGDAALRAALDAVEGISARYEDVASRRHRATHTYLVDDADLSRFAELGVVADLQQSPDALDPDYRASLREIIGARADDLIPLDQLAGAGATITLSSDWDAGPLSPLGTIERALTRDIARVADRKTAIAHMTIDAARALGRDGETGSITAGKQADFVILERDILEIPVDEIDETPIRATYLGGVAVYDRDRDG